MAGAGHLGRLDDAPEQHLPFGLSERPPSSAVRQGEPLEQRVERADRSREEPVAPPDELAFGPIDLGSIRDDEPRIAIDLLDEPVEQERDLAGMRRPDDEGETHRCMVVGPTSRPGLRPGRESTRKGARSEDQASDLGLRPRRATAAPGIPPAQESQRSAAFAPRRASLNVTRSTAPFPSSTSLPHESQTRTVFRATS